MWEGHFDAEQLRYLVVDKGGLLPEMFLFDLISGMTNLKKMLVTGDQHQLPPFTGTITESIICMGHEGTIHKLMNNPTIGHIRLN